MTLLNYKISRILIPLDKLEDVDAASPNNNDVLTYNSTSENWEAQAASGGGGGTYSYQEVNSNYSLQASDDIVGVNATSNTVITLPAAASRTDKPYIIKRLPADVGAFSVELDTTGGETIDGVLLFNLPLLTSLTLFSTGTEWIVL